MRFLRSLEHDPQPWLVAYMIKQRNRWERWQERDRRSLKRHRGLTEEMTDAWSGNEYALRKAFYYAKRMRYIEIARQGNRLVVAVSDRGRTRLLRGACATAPLLPSGQILLVMFDVPVRANHARRALWYFLREQKFQRLQHSVWYSDRDMEEPLRAFIESLAVGAWVHLAKANLITLLKKQKKN